MRAAHMVTAEGLTLRSPRGQHRPQGALQCRPRAHCNHCWGYTGPATQARCHPCSGSFLLFFKRHHLPWSMTQRARLLLGSLGDFRGTILMRRVRALSRPWPETPTSVSSSKRLLMRTFSSRAGSGNKTTSVGYMVAQPHLTLNFPSRPGRYGVGEPASWALGWVPALPTGALATWNTKPYS